MAVEERDELLEAVEQDRCEIVNGVLGENYLEGKAYDAYVRALRIRASRQCEIAMLKDFDKLCSEQGVHYFMFGAMLKGAVAYSDFLPDSSAVTIGLLRADYDRFLEAVHDGAADRLCWCLVEFYEGKLKHVRRPRPQLRSKEALRVMSGDACIFGKDSMPIEVQPAFSLHIFDEVPDDFYLRKKFFRKMQRRNILLKKGLGAYELFGATGLGYGESLKSFHGMTPLRAFVRRLIPLGFISRLEWKTAGKYAGSGSSRVTSVMYSRSKTCYMGDLGAMPYRSFSGISLRAPERPDLWARVPILNTPSDLLRLQSDAKEIVQEIDRVCKRLGIGYFVCGGTMLGYVRHGGFIPWDDDIDVGMLRADYERFVNEAASEMDGERFFLQTRKSDPNIPYLFSKVRMNGTEYLTEYNIDRDFHKGICVDVFPFDYLPNDLKAQKAMRKAVKAAEKRHNHIVNRQYPDMGSGAPKKNLDWLSAQVVGRILTRHYWKFSLADTQAAYDKAAMACDALQGEDSCGEFVASFVPTFTMVRIDDLLPLRQVQFEDIKVNVPANPDVFLQMQYGDYLVMPYPHQRMGHDLLLWSDKDGIGGTRLVDTL